MTYLPTLLAAGGRGVAVPYAATITPDLSAPLNLVGALTGPATIANVTPASGQGRLVLVFQQDATGGRALTWGSLYRNAPQPGQAANALDAIEFIWNGSAWVTGAADVATAGGGGSTPAWWSSLTLGSGATAAQIATNTTAIRQQIDAAAATTMIGMQFQDGTGGYLAGATAPGGGEVRLPAGVIAVTNLILGHRVALVGQGWGTVLYQASASTGPVVRNRRDSTGHAAYCQVRDLTIHGNADGQTAANDGILWQGDTTFTYTSTLDEDWDIHCLIQNVQIIRCKGSGLHTQGSGENQARGFFIRSCDGIGLWAEGYDSWFSDFSIAHSGLQGLKADGDSNRFANGKVWYSGRITAGSGHGYHLTLDTGELTNCEAQDNTACGFLFDFAHNLACAGLKADSNSRNSPGAYPGFDLYGCGFVTIAGASASNRYNASGPTSANNQPQTVALRHRNGDGANDIGLTAGTGVWGTVTAISGDSVRDTSYIRVNGTVMP